MKLYMPERVIFDPKSLEYPLGMELYNTSRIITSKQSKLQLGMLQDIFPEIHLSPNMLIQKDYCCYYNERKGIGCMQAFSRF